MISDRTDSRIEIPRHLQDFNGYCGPACALMMIDFAGSSQSPPVFAQNDFLREIRAHANSNSDRRPVKSPAESLLALINEHTAAPLAYEKAFSPLPQAVAARIIQAIDSDYKPCPILVSKGMHWVIAFAVHHDSDHAPLGIFMRDPAWPDMPRFFGLTIFPDKPALAHTPGECDCLHLAGDEQNDSPATLHERHSPSSNTKSTIPTSPSRKTSISPNKERSTHTLARTTTTPANLHKTQL